MTNLAVWYSHIDVEATIKELRSEIDPVVRKRATANVAKARTPRQSAGVRQADPRRGRAATHHRQPAAVQQLAGEYFRGNRQRPPPRDARGILRNYRRTLQSDRRHLLEEFLSSTWLARSWCGGVGRGAWIILLLGRDDNDPLFLQAKEAQASVLEEFARRGGTPIPWRTCRPGPASHASEQRHLPGLGHGARRRRRRRDYYVRQLRDWKGAALSRDEARHPRQFSRMSASALARAHARSGDRIAIAAYLGGSDAFDQAIAEFSEAYADQTSATTTPSCKRRRTGASPRNATFESVARVVFEHAADRKPVTEAHPRMSS